MDDYLVEEFLNDRDLELCENEEYVQKCMRELEDGSDG